MRSDHFALRYQRRRCSCLLQCALGMLLVLCSVLAHAQTALLTYTGVWSNVSATGLTSPRAVTGDSAGNLYIADYTLSAVVKIAANGMQSTIGSNLSSPTGLALDTAGNLYVTSSGNNTVYKITPGGTQTTLGSGWSAPTSVAVDSNNNVFVTDGSGLSEVTAGGVQSVLEMDNIVGVAVDAANNIYYGDITNSAVFEIPAGTNNATDLFFVSNVEGLYVDALGSIYVAESSIGVRRADDQYGDYTVFGDTAASYGVWQDNAQNLYIADAAGRVEKLSLGSADFGSVEVCPTGATVTPCSSSRTLNFALDSIVDATSASSSVTQGTPGLDYNLTADSCTASIVEGGSCSMTLSFTPEEAGLRQGAALAMGSSEVDDIAHPVGARRAHGSHSAGKVSPREQSAGTLLSSVLLHGIGIAPIGQFSSAPIITTGLTPEPGSFLSGIAVTAGGDLYATDPDHCVVQEFSGGITTVVAGTTCGPAAGDGGAATSAVLNGPVKTIVDGAGNLYIGGFDGAVREVNAATGVITTIAGNGASGYSGDGGLATSAELEEPLCLALDTAGNLYIGDQSANVVRVVNAQTGIITTIAGNGTPGYSGDNGPATSAELNFPDALAIDSAGNLYIADDNNNVVRKVSAGVITTVAGNGTGGYSGDGGPATAAQLNDPEGLSVDPAGNIYIADAANFLVRRVDVNTGIISRVVGAYSGTPSDTGNGGPSTSAGLSYLGDVAVDGVGEIFVADSGNQIVRATFGPVGIAQFGSAAVGSSSAAQDISFINVGTSPLIVSSLLDPANFSLGGADTTCTSSSVLAPAAGCVMGIELVPAAEGALSGQVMITDNIINSPGYVQVVLLSGSGTGAATAKLAFPGNIAPIVAGGNLGTVFVDVESSAGALVTNATNTVTLLITGPGGYSDTVIVAAASGVATFNLSTLPLDAPGTYTLTATSPALTQAQTTVNVTVNQAVPAKLAIPSIATTIVSGANLGIVPVDVESSLAAIVTTATNAVTLTVTGPGGYSYTATVSAVNGVANFDLRGLALTTPGAYTLTATSAGLTLARAVVMVTPVPTQANTPVQLAIITPLPANLASGENLGVVAVNIENSSGGLISGAGGQVTLIIKGPQGYSYSFTVTAVNGVATFDLSALPLTIPGTYTVTAASGSLKTAIETVTVTVDFTIAVSRGTPAASVPILPGAAADFSFTLAPASGSFPSAITLSATGLPAGATFSFAPASVTPGASPAATALTIQTLRTASAALHDQRFSDWAAPWRSPALALLLLPLSATRRMRKAIRRGPLMSIAFLLLALGLTAGLGGCGAGGLFGQPQQSYTITVTGTSGSLSHSATVTLTVQ